MLLFKEKPVGLLEHFSLVKVVRRVSGAQTWRVSELGLLPAVIWGADWGFESSEHC